MPSASVFRSLRVKWIKKTRANYLGAGPRGIC